MRLSNSSRTTGGLVKTAIQISPEQFLEIEALARERQISISAVIREAIRLYLAGLKNVVIAA